MQVGILLSKELLGEETPELDGYYVCHPSFILRHGQLLDPGVDLCVCLAGGGGKWKVQ